MSTLRPIQHLEAVSRDYPGIWKKYAKFLAMRREIGDWPPWCFCPLAAAHAVAVGTSAGTPLEPSRALDIARIGALAAWRTTQGIYRFDPTLLKSLLDTPVTGEMPTEHLLHLPEWCTYVELQSREPLGFFAYNEYDIRKHRAELTLLLDYPEGLLPVAIELRGTLEEALNRFITHVSQYSRDVAVANATDLIGPLLSVLLYLCSEDAEMRPSRDPKRTHDPQRIKVDRDGKPYLPPARRPEVWETGFNLGAALRAAAATTATLESARSPRGHIRRAHWHSYWKGTRDARELYLRWLPPIAVKLDVPEAPTVHRVKDSS